MADVLKYGNAIRLAQLATDPSSPENGTIYYNTTTNEVKQYVSGGWQTVSVQELTAGVGIEFNSNAIDQIAKYVPEIDTPAVDEGIRGKDSSGNSQFIAGYCQSTVFSLPSDTLVIGSTVEGGIVLLGSEASHGLTTGAVIISSGSVISGNSNTGNTILVSGDASSGNGNSGAVIISSGNVSSGTRGAVNITGNGISLDSTAGNINANSNEITNVADPTAGSSAATKQYVDAVAEGLRPKEAVRAASTANVVIATGLENGDSVDGVTLATGDRVLLKDQTLPEENGIYIVAASGAASRSTDFDSLTPIDEINGAYVPVQEGTANAGIIYVQYGTVSVIGTDPINFVYFNSISNLIGGDGITISGTNVSVDHDGQGLQFVANQLALELDGSTLSKSASGLKVADQGISNTQVNNAAAIDVTKIGNGDVDNTELSYVNGVTSSIQTQLNNKQPLDATLTSLAAYNTNGLLTQTAADTFTGRTITAGSAISVADGNGVAGNPTITVDINGTTAETSPDNADTILIYDNSAAANRKMTRGNFLSGIAVASAGDLNEGSFTGLANNTADQTITGFAFNNGVVRSFKALVSIFVDATSDQFAVYELMGIQRGADWQMSESYTGDTITGLTFTITSAGQVRATIGNITGFTSAAIKFRAYTTSV